MENIYFHFYSHWYIARPHITSRLGFIIKYILISKKIIWFRGKGIFTAIQVCLICKLECNNASFEAHVHEWVFIDISPDVECNSQCLGITCFVMLGIITKFFYLFCYF